VVRVAFVWGALLLPALASAAWFKGNTHAHTLNSDGNAAPVEVVRWYREHGYQFVVITDHEFLTDVAPLQALYGADGKFLVMPGQEVSQMIADPSHQDGLRQAHVNGIGTSRLVIPMGEGSGMGRTAPRGTTVADTFVRNIAAIAAAGGVAQINHPNFRWSIGVEDFGRVPAGTLFEVWNGHIAANNLGGVDEAGHRSLSSEELWDALLTRRKRLWGVASDDSHDYHAPDNPDAARPGQAWIFVRADTLSSEQLMAALKRGDFYASTGVVLDELVVRRSEISIRIARSREAGKGGLSSDDVRYLTRFIGTGGRVLAEVVGHSPRYSIRGDEGYVRASVTDSNGRHAWTQPVFVPLTD
jgi:hypothetical protein